MSKKYLDKDGLSYFWGKVNTKKQDKIDSSHKLNSDLVDDTDATNKFVTSGEKNTWDSKQDALVSGTNIRTINGYNLLTSGNLNLMTTTSGDTSTTLTYSADFINKRNKYSTSEVYTFKTWVDGKKIYRKVFKVNSFPNNGNSWISCNVSNLGTVIKLEGYETNGSEAIFLASAYSSSIHDCLVFDYVRTDHNNSIRIHTTSDRSGYSGYVWMEYTKTS